jgi:hypothetical protein
MYRKLAWLLAVVNCPPLAAAAGALAVEVGGNTGCFIALAGIPACMGLLILSLYKLLDFED